MWGGWTGRESKGMRQDDAVAISSLLPQHAHIQPRPDNICAEEDADEVWQTVKGLSWAAF